MFTNYLKVTLRNLARNSLFVIINIIALGLALSIAIVAYLNHKYDADWDKSHVRANEIYKVNFTREIQGQQQPYGATPIPVGNFIGENISGVEAVIRFTCSSSPLKLDLNNFTRTIGYADPGFMELFTFPIVKGSAEAFKDRQNILIDETIASAYFGEEDPIGKIMSIFNDNGEEFTYTVGAVFQDLPLNTSFQFRVLTQMDNFLDMWEVDETRWQIWIAATFLHIPNPSQAETVEKLLGDMVPAHNQAREDFQISGFRLQPFLDVAHDSWDMWNDWWVRNSFHPAAVTAPPIMALLILLIACFNFTNTSIAFSSKRLKEIGVRKVAGGHRKQIIAQFMGENFLLTLLGLLLSLFVARFLTSTYSAMWEYMELEFSLLDNPALVIFLILLLLFTAFLAGAYPSFYISKFNPVNIFQDKLKIGGKNVLTVILLTFQISISVMAIISGIIYWQNAEYQDNVYMGYDKDNIIGMRLNSEESFIALRDVVKTNPLILSVGESDEHIGWGNYRRTMEYNDIKEDVSMLDVGHGYFETMGLQLLDGRAFTREFEQTDKGRSIIVNEKFIKDFGIEDPVGKRIVMSDTVQLYIIGIMADYFPYGTWSEVQPTAFYFVRDDRHLFLTIKSEIDNLKTVNEYLEEEWKKVIPNFPYSGFFQDSLMDDARQINGNIKDMYIFLGFIALILSAIGLYTLVALSIIRRTKEVGVRKVMGSSVQQIIFKISKPYAIIIGIASVIGLISGWKSSVVMMASIWNIYTGLTAYTFIIPVALILLVAIFSIGWKVYSAASRNPTESLRYE
jgi:ABC-type antimicrobial peptide transport system permease subunit